MAEETNNTEQKEEQKETKRSYNKRYTADELNEAVQKAVAEATTANRRTSCTGQICYDFVYWRNRTGNSGRSPEMGANHVCGRYARYSQERLFAGYRHTGQQCAFEEP